MNSVQEMLKKRESDLLAKISDSTVSSRKRRYASTIEIPRVRAALERLAQGEYGICTECGEAIEKDRLQAIPEIHTCKDCAETERDFIEAAE